MGKRSGLDGASRGSITGSQVGIKRIMPARPSVTMHARRSVGTHPVAPPNDFSDPGSQKGTTMALLSQQGQFRG